MLFVKLDGDDGITEIHHIDTAHGRKETNRRMIRNGVNSAEVWYVNDEATHYRNATKTGDVYHGAE